MSSQANNLMRHFNAASGDNVNLLEVGARDGKRSKLLTRNHASVTVLNLGAPKVYENRILFETRGSNELQICNITFDNILAMRCLDACRCHH